MKTTTILLGIIAVGLASVLIGCGDSDSDQPAADAPRQPAAPMTTPSATPENQPQEAVPGNPAPDFALQDQNGRTVRLSDYAGKIVVLEWTNPECPFVVRHYAPDKRTMVRLAREFAEHDVVWLAIDSSHTVSVAANLAFHTANQLPYPVLDDHQGTVGRAYEARTTPHMFVIDKQGVIAYRGAIDDDPAGRSEDVQNYVHMALEDLLAGRPVSTPDTRPYGCSVKYEGL